MIPQLDHDALQSRYQLLCQASQPNSRMNSALQCELNGLEKLFKTDFIALTRQGCPDNITDILKAFDDELTRFRGFCEFPNLATKTIVGIGGGFSAGKSTFINTLVDRKRLLAAEIDPTTSMPAYVLKGEEESIQAINIHNCVMSMTAEQFASLTHEEKEIYGSQVGILLRSAFISLPDFQWDNLAFLDTPGYSKPEQEDYSARTDEDLARHQLNTADFIIWAVPADNGTISENDLAFLSTLKRDIPKLIVVTRVGKKTEEDVVAIVELMKTTTQNRGIQVIDVLPIESNNKRFAHTFEPVKAYLAQWNAESRPLQFAQNFKRLFMQYQSYVDDKERHAYFRMDKINRILTMSGDEETTQAADVLMASVKQDLATYTQQKNDLAELNQAFFTQLKAIGDLAGVPLPEPNAIDLIDLKDIDLLGMIRELRIEQGLDEPVIDKFAAISDAKPSETALKQLLRLRDVKPLAFDLVQGEMKNLPQLLREKQQNQALKDAIFNL